MIEELNDFIHEINEKLERKGNKELPKSMRFYTEWIIKLRDTLAEIEECNIELPWKPFVIRPLTEDEKEEFPEIDSIMECDFPDENQNVIVSDGVNVWGDTMCYNGMYYYLKSERPITDNLAWKPVPSPHVRKSNIEDNTESGENA